MRHFIALIRRLGRSALRAKWLRQDRKRAIDLALMDPIVKMSGANEVVLMKYYRNEARNLADEIHRVNDSSKGYK